jgi:hypothetical protein
MPANGEPLPARHGKCGVSAGTARQSPDPKKIPALPAISLHGILPSAGTHPWTGQLTDHVFLFRFHAIDSQQ